MTNDKNSCILVLIPAWNEVKHIGSLVKAARHYTSVLVVDDGSSDGTADLARRSGAFVIHHNRNKGKGCALRTGFGWAMDHGYDAVITLDADGQHDPAEIPKFISAYLCNGAEMTVGQRDFSNIPFPRNLSNWLGSRLLSLALGQMVPDASCGYRLYTRRMLERVDLQAKKFDIEAEAVGKAIICNMNIGWIKIRTIYARGRKSYYRSLRDVPHFLRIVWKSYRSKKNGKSRAASRLD